MFGAHTLSSCQYVVGCRGDRSSVVATIRNSQLHNAHQMAEMNGTGTLSLVLLCQSLPEKKITSKINSDNCFFWQPVFTVREGICGQYFKGSVYIYGTE
jgi:hypothetical protein